MLDANLNQVIRLGDLHHITSGLNPDVILKFPSAFVGVYDSDGVYLGYIDVLSETFHESK